jgi:hypothetical protein
MTPADLTPEELTRLEEKLLPRLRSTRGYMQPDQRTIGEAWVAMERLLSSLRRAREERDEARAQRDYSIERLANEIASLRAEVARLTAERDAQ